MIRKICLQFACIILLIVSCIYSLDTYAQVMQTEPFPAAEALSSQATGTYQPFTDPKLWGEEREQPMLRGPGGEPVGGLPISDSTYAFFFCVMGYTIYKMFSQRVKPRIRN